MKSVSISRKYCYVQLSGKGAEWCKPIRLKADRIERRTDGYHLLYADKIVGVFTIDSLVG